MRWPRSTGHFAQRGPESPESKRLCQVKTDWLVHLPHTSTGVNSPCQIPNGGTWRLSGRHSRICQGNKREYGQSNSNHSGSAYSYSRRTCWVSEYACLDVELRAKANPNNRHIFGGMACKTSHKRRTVTKPGRCETHPESTQKRLF